MYAGSTEGPLDLLLEYNHLWGTMYLLFFIAIYDHVPGMEVKNHTQLKLRGGHARQNAIYFR